RRTSNGNLRRLPGNRQAPGSRRSPEMKRPAFLPRLTMLGFALLVSAGAGGWPARLGKSVSDPPARTYYRDILPILQRHCQVCHRAGGIAPMAFATYLEAKSYSEAIRNSVRARSMPPWFADPAVGRFQNDPSLSLEEIAAISDW